MRNFLFFGEANEIKNSGLLFNVIVSESLTFGLSNKKRKNNVSYANLRPKKSHVTKHFLPLGVSWVWCSVQTLAWLGVIQFFGGQIKGTAPSSLKANLWCLQKDHTTTS